MIISSKNGEFLVLFNGLVICIGHPMLSPCSLMEPFLIVIQYVSGHIAFHMLMGRLSNFKDLAVL